MEWSGADRYSQFILKINNIIKCNKIFFRNCFISLQWLKTLQIYWGKSCVASINSTC